LDQTLIISKNHQYIIWTKAAMTEEKTEEAKEINTAHSGCSNDERNFASSLISSTSIKNSLPPSMDEFDHSNGERDQNLSLMSTPNGNKRSDEGDTVTMKYKVEYSNSVRARNRCLITVFHFVITYPRWSIALFILVAMLTYPLSTYEEQVVRPLRNLERLIQIESDLYHDCVIQGFQSLTKNMNRTVQIEKDRIDSARIQNTIRVNNAEFTTSTCEKSVQNIRRLLETWQRLSNTPIPLKINTTYSDETCTSQDQNWLRDMMGTTIANKDENIVDLIDEYASQSLTSLQKVADYTKDRSAYDYDYFIGQKFDRLSAILTNFSIPDAQIQFPSESVVLDIQLILQNMTMALKDCYVRIDLMSFRLTEFKTSLDAFYLNYIDLYNRFDAISVFVRDFVPDSVSLPSFFDISGLPTADMLIPPTLSIPEFDAVLPDIDIITTQAIQDVLDLLYATLLETAKDASHQTQEIIERMIEKLKEILRLEDYNPPKYPIGSGSSTIQSPSDEINALKQLSSQAKSNADTILKQLEDRKDSVSYENSTLPPLDIDTASDFDLEGSNRFTSLETQLPDMSVPIWLVVVVTWICKRSMYIECLTQLIRLIRLKHKYEKDIQPELPEINFAGKKNEDEDEEETNSRTNNPLDTVKLFFLRYCCNPWVIFGSLCIPLLFFMLIFWFPHIKQSCIDSRNGTFVARNVITPILINKANYRGHAAHSTSTMDCFHKRNSICSEMLSETVEKHENDVRSMRSFLSRFNASGHNIAAVNRCIDDRNLDRQLEKHCCGLQGYFSDNETCEYDQKKDYCPIDDTQSPPTSFRPLSVISVESGCDATFEPNLDDTTFNCNVLKESCKFETCTGVDENLILQMTIDVDCRAEIYTIQFCMFIALVVYHAIMINLIVSFLFNGMKCIWWRRIRSDRIKMTTLVNEKGEVLIGSDRSDLASRISIMIKTYERLGRIQLGIGGCILVWWLASFFLLKNIMSHIEIYR
jgi:hypothetical protein